MKTRLTARLALVAVLLGTLIVPAGNVSAATTGLKPVSYVTYEGGDNGTSYTAMRLRDQSGSQDDPSKYVAFTTPASIYRGVHKFRLPASVPYSNVTSLKLTVNYKGPAKASQTWTWALYDWNASKWVVVGNNTKAAANTWSLLAFSAATPKRFINAGTREIKLKLQSNNAGGNAKIDFEVIRVGYGTPPVGTGPTIAGCPVYPLNNIWNAPVDTLPVHARSNAWVNSIGSATGFHMDFGSGTWDGGPIGIPYNIVSGTQARVNVTFDYADESDKGPYPIPADPKIEWGSDHHILIVDKDNCKLYELYDARKVAGKWRAGSGAVWDLYSNALRPKGWTSADAAGLPILPGLVRYEEVLAGEIEHAIRFTAPSTNSYIWPARHLTSGSPGVLTNTPPMGARFRLKASFNISGFPPKMQVILRAMKKYGIILADNGSPWYVSGAPDPRWDNDMLHLLDALKGSNFEAVDVSSLMQNANSGATTAAQSWQPPVGASWQIQFTGPIETGVNAAVFDLDLFDTGAARVASLHSQGKKVICYISAGSWEDWRPDADQFPDIVLGNDYDGWPGEKWLDIRRIDLLAPILRARLDLCAGKGFDGVDPDNLDGYTNVTGFPLTAQDQLKFNRWLAKEAHARGLAVGLKNDPGQVSGLLAYFDWALTEDCFDQGWCGMMSPFVNAGKPVFAIEYTDTGITLDDFCPQAAALKFSAILKNRDLDAYREACP